jgi:hypothetical protein
LQAAPQQILNSGKSTINNVTKNLTEAAARNGLQRSVLPGEDPQEEQEHVQYIQEDRRG